MLEERAGTSTAIWRGPAAKASADAGMTEADAATAKAQAEAQAAINAALEEAKKAAAAQAEALNARLEVQLKDAEAQIAQARAAAMSALRQVATETAATVITRLTGVTPDAGRSCGTSVGSGARGIGGDRRAEAGAATCRRDRDGTPRESFFADPGNWVVGSFILFFVLFGRQLWKALCRPAGQPRRWW